METDPSIIRFGVFELDLKNRELRRSGVLINLPRQAFRILSLLAARPNELVTREEIRSEIWPNELFADLDSRLNFEIKRVREALADDADRPRYVETVRKGGYKFIASLDVREPAVAKPVPEERGQGEDRSAGELPTEPGPAAAEEKRARPWAKLPARPAALITLFAICLLAGGFWYATLGREGGPRAVERSSKLATGPLITSVSRIEPKPDQTIVIKGRGFGTHCYYANQDTPFLAIRDKSTRWAAGRIVPENWDEVTLNVASWTDSEIVVTGFAGAYGSHWWKLKSGDEVEIVVYNPQTGAGPATRTLRVSSFSASLEK